MPRLIGRVAKLAKQRVPLSCQETNRQSFADTIARRGDQHAARPISDGIRNVAACKEPARGRCAHAAV